MGKFNIGGCDRRRHEKESHPVVVSPTPFILKHQIGVLALPSTAGSSSLKLADRGFKLEILLWESFLINVVITLKSVF